MSSSSSRSPCDPKLHFESAWTAHRQRSDQTPPRRRREPPDDETPLRELQRVEAQQRALSLQEMIRRRLDVGYVWRGGNVGDNFVPAFVESGLRTQSADAHVLRRFVQSTPRARRNGAGLQCGHGKGRLAAADSKLLGLDERYISLNPVMRAGWRVDLDRDFPSWAALRDDLEQLVKAGRLPCLPHACVASVCRRTGRVARPHLWWLLPYGSSVWWAPEDARCNQRIMSFYRGVVAGCTEALLPLGADPSAACLPLKGKNPLAPLWSSVFWNQDVFPSLSDWAEYVDTGATPGRLARRAAMDATGLGPDQSNALFLQLQKLAYDTLRDLSRAADPAYQAALADRARLAALLEARCRKAVAAMADALRERRQAFAIFRRVADYAAGAWDPARLRGAVDRGACADEVVGLSLAERQAVGGRYGAAQRADTTRRAVAAAFRELEDEGVPATQPAIVARTGLSLSTVKRHWAAARRPSEAGVIQCIVPQAPEAAQPPEADLHPVLTREAGRETTTSTGRRVRAGGRPALDSAAHTPRRDAGHGYDHPLVAAALAHFPTAVCVRVTCINGV